MPLHLNTKSRGSNGGGGGSDRVCDGCYNRLTYEANTRNIALAKAKKELLLQQEKEKEQDEKDELLNGATTTAPATATGSPAGGGVLSSETDNGVSDLKETLGEIEESLRERGEKLKDLSKKGADLENVRPAPPPSLPSSSSWLTHLSTSQAAQEYSRVTKQILIQQETAAQRTGWRKKKSSG
jgi:hypothetical protein